MSGATHSLDAVLHIPCAGCIVDGNYWPRAIRICQDMNDMAVLEGDLRDVAADRLYNMSLASDPLLCRP